MLQRLPIFLESSSEICKKSGQEVGRERREKKTWERMRERKSPRKALHFPAATRADSPAEGSALAPYPHPLGPLPPPPDPTQTNTHLRHPFLLRQQEPDFCTSRVFKLLERLLCAQTPNPWQSGIKPAGCLELKFAFLFSVSRQPQPLHILRAAAATQVCAPCSFPLAASLQRSPPHSLFLCLFPSFNLISVFLSIFQLLSDELF